MFRKVFIFAMFATAAGYCFASQDLPQVVTSEVFYDTEMDVIEDEFVQETVPQYIEIPAWPLAGTDADVMATCGDAPCTNSNDNIRIVSKIGDDLIVENNFNLGMRGGSFGGWSGGANMLHGNQIPVGFADECNSGAEMPLLHREVLEDDGGRILTVSRSGRKNCNQYSDGYAAFLAKNERAVEKLVAIENDTTTVSNTITMGGDATTDVAVTTPVIAGTGEALTLTTNNGSTITTKTTETEIAVDMSADAEPSVKIADQVRSWVVANGQTLRQVLQSWCDKEGWDLVWATSREYPIQASAVFKGRFVDVASALVRNFGRATPIPYAKFYKGNRVLVISTNEE